MILRVTRFVLAALAVLLGGALLLFSATSWRQAPAFFPASQVSPAAWTAFSAGMGAVAVALLCLATFATWRTRAFSRASSPPDADRAFLGGPFRLPRYVVDVAGCLTVAVVLLAAPVLIVQGSPQTLLAPFWTTLAIIGLIAGGLLGAVRR